MTNNIIPDSKKCTKCGEIKSLTEFYRAKHGLYGRYSKCKKCKDAYTRAYRKTPAGKRMKMKSNRKYYRSKRGKKQKAKDQRVYIKRYPERHQAHTAVGRAIMNGKIPRASELACNRCGQPADEYHHHNGYDRKHRLDVIPLCKPCHNIEG